MSSREKHLKDLPLQRELRKIQRQREKFQVLMAYNALVEGLIETDEKINDMPEGEQKEEKKRQQEEAWQIMFADDMISLIKIEM
jgi:23S rRNA-/tRNA-specific pseudouridylate synthase